VTDSTASVVIPTRGRPSLVVRAVRSALVQTAPSLEEVIVVVDGPEPDTEAALARIVDPRMRLIVLPRPAGPGAARNAGVAASSGAVIAFLDDDDEWKPQKLEAQLAELRASGASPVIVSCRLLARDGAGGARIWPRRLPDADEPLAEYLLARRGLRWGEGLAQTSTLAVRRELLVQVPFSEDRVVEPHEDLDWLLRAAHTAGAVLVFARPDEPLVVWNIDAGRARASGRREPLRSLDWIRSVRPIVPRRAYAAFVLAWIVPDLEGFDRLRLLPRLLREAFRHGRPSAVDLLIALGCALLPARIRTVRG
jgi:glycosyltransferase involved in cell wall biosynthesis